MITFPRHHSFRKLLPFGLTFLFLIGLMPAFGQTAVPWLEGDWQGVGYQAPTDSKWEIELQYDSTENRLRIVYPDLACGGHWELVELRDGYAEFRERITEGQDNCDNNVQVIVNRIDEQYISVAYFLPDYYDGVVAYSVLRRVPDPKVRIKVPSGKIKRT